MARGGTEVRRRREIAVGALLCRPQNVQRVLDSLAKLQAALGRNDAMELGPIARGKVLRCVYASSRRVPPKLTISREPLPLV